MLAASLLDDDLSTEERAAAEAAIAGCPACAALRADLLALASATRDLPSPVRTRDFMLTAEDAARLSATAVRELDALTARLSGEMTGTTTSAAHASHDTVLVASLIDHSLPAAERAVAEAQVASCGLCAALYADLEMLRAATRALPTPPRPHDYSLTPDDAARLRRSGWRRWVAAFGSPRDAFSRPLAVGLTTLGLAGLLIANVPSVMVGSATSGAAPVFDNGAGGPATDRGGDVTVNAPESAGGQGAPPPAAAAPSGDLAIPGGGAVRPVPAASGRTSVGADPSGPRAPNYLTDGAASAEPGSGKSGTGKGSGRQEGATGSEVQAAAGAPSVPPLVLLSGSLLIVGLGLFVLRWGARRFGD
jgi:anti-sigma factor RsiW